MSSNHEEELQRLQVELSEKLEALQTQGLDEADRATATTALLVEFSAKMQAAAVAKAQASVATSSSASHHTTIIAEQSEKISLKSLSNEDLQAWGDKLKVSLKFRISKREHLQP